MKRTLAALGALLLVFQMIPAFGGIPKAHAEMSGDGSSTEPFIVMTAQNLSDIRNDLGASYKLGADIDLSGYDAGDGNGWLPIGSDGDRFTGTLDGNGYTIRNMTINRSSMNYVGLFGSVSGILDNVQLIDIHVDGNSFVGGLAGITYGQIRNSYATGEVIGHYRLSDNPFTGTSAVGGYYVGGLTGQLAWGSILSSWADVDVDGGEWIGGTTGLNYGGAIANAFSRGQVNGYRRVGGLAGAQDNVPPSISNAYAAGSVSGVRVIGGLLASISYGTVNSSYWNTDTSVASSVAGTGKTTIELMQRTTFEDWDFTNTWGIRDGESYPYLLAFKPKLHIAPLSHAIDNPSLEIAGTVLDGSFGEEISINYDIKNNAGESQRSVTNSVYANGKTNRSINRSR